MRDAIITIRLTRRDHEVLLGMLGFANGAQQKQEGFIHPAYKEVTDWILIQGAPDNHTYFFEKEKLRRMKEAEIKEITEIAEIVVDAFAAESREIR